MSFQPIELTLLDITPMMSSVHGVVMELQDCALTLLKGILFLQHACYSNSFSFSLSLSCLDIVPTDDPEVAFNNIDVAILVGAMPRREGMERKDLLKANAKIFESQGKALDKCAKKTVKVCQCSCCCYGNYVKIKVLVVGNPANTNCYLAAKMAPSIPKENFTCLTRLDQNRAQAQVSNKWTHSYYNGCILMYTVIHIDCS